MPKLVRREARDPNRSAFRVLQQTIAAETPATAQKKTGRAKAADVPAPPKGLSDYMAAIGRKGGQTSGARRMANLTTEQRRSIALKAARARWEKEKAKRR